MSTLPAEDLEAISLRERDARNAGRQISTASTRYGQISFTDHGDGHGVIWCREVMPINRRDHVLIGGYTQILEWGANDAGDWRPDADKPLVVFWDPGLRRLDGKEPTDTAALAIGRAVAQAMIHG